MNKILKISEAAALAIHTMSILASYPDKHFSTKEIASILSASEHHLAKVLQSLSKDGFVKSLRGPDGGFIINKPFNKVSLYDIFQSIDGGINNRCCLFQTPVCSSKDCILGKIIQKVSSEVKEELSNKKLIDIKYNIKKDKKIKED